MLNVTFRKNKKFGEIEMFYYNDRKDLECVCISEGHNVANYDYYIKNTTPCEPCPQLLKLYSDTELKVLKRLTRPR